MKTKTLTVWPFTEKNWLTLNLGYVVIHKAFQNKNKQKEQ